MVCDQELTQSLYLKMQKYYTDDIFNCIFFNEDYRIPNFTEICSHESNKPELVQVMAWRRTDDKLLPGPMMTEFIDAYMRH